MNLNEVTVTDSWSETFEKSDLSDLCCEFLELGLDSIVENELIKEIPIIRTVVSVYKIGNSLRERSYLRKLAMFISEIDREKIDDNSKEKYLSRIEKDKKTIHRELEYVLTILDRFVSEEKSRYLGRLYLSYIKGKINWILFCQFSETIDRILPGDIESINRNVMENKNRNYMENCSLQRMQGLSIVMPNEKPNAFDYKGNPIAVKFDGTYKLTIFGKTMYDIIDPAIPDSKYRSSNLY